MTSFAARRYIDADDAAVMNAPDYWRRRAHRTAARHNFACTLAVFLPWSLGLSALFACVLVMARENNILGSEFWIGYGIGLLACAEWALRRARPGFFTPAEGMVRLESRLRLHNRLSAASAGVGEFPAPQAAPDGYAFRWERIALPLAGAAALVLAAANVPLAKRTAVYRPPATPVAWTQTAQWIDELKKTEALQEPALAQLRERLEQLQKQPAEDWYSQSSLEAGDSLHGQTQQSIEALQRDLQSALGNLQSLERFSDQTSPAEMKSAHENLASALKGLALGNLPLSADLLSNLKAADLSNSKSLTPAQLEKLKDRLKAGDKACQNCLHPGEMEARLKNGEVASVTMRPGGAGGGERSAPLTLNQKPMDLGSAAVAPVASNDLEHAMPGDLMGVGKGEHPVDQTKYAGPAPAGAIRSHGDGGEAVWRNDLTPNEREVLKNFFK